MAKYTLTNKGYMGLGIYLGFKSTYRRAEMTSFGIDYDETFDELVKVGLIKNGRIVTSKAKEAFNERFAGQLTSQTHQYSEQLGFKRVGYY